MSHFQTLLGVAIEHSYNSAGVCPCLKLNPTEKTRALFKKTGLLCKQTSDGIQIVYDKTRLEALELYAQDLQDPLSFDFKACSLDPDFRSYSEPFSAVEKGILYFDNRKVGGAGRQRLSVSEIVSDKDFRHLDSSEVEGMLSQQDRLLPPEFVLRIYADNNKGPLLEQWLAQPPTIYSVRFSSRQRYWKYYLLGKMARNNQAGNDFYIVDSDNQIEFESTGDETLSNQRIAYTFRSKQRIPLKERYTFRFQLKQKNAQGVEIEVISQLPFASVKQAGMERVGEQETVVSEIYINS